MDCWVECALTSVCRHIFFEEGGVSMPWKSSLRLVNNNQSNLIKFNQTKEIRQLSSGCLAMRWNTEALFNILFRHILSPHNRNGKAANVVLDICVQRRYKVWQAIVRVLYTMLLLGLQSKTMLKATNGSDNAGDYSKENIPRNHEIPMYTI